MLWVEIVSFFMSALDTLGKCDPRITKCFEKEGNKNPEEAMRSSTAYPHKIANKMKQGSINMYSVHAVLGSCTHVFFHNFMVNIHVLLCSMAVEHKDSVHDLHLVTWSDELTYPL